MKINDKKNINIFSVGSLENLLAAYNRIKSKAGNLTPGSTPETLDGIDLKWFLKAQSDLLAGKYRFQPARRVLINKPGKTEKRPLGVGSPRDKVIQAAIQIQLENHFEPLFLDSSHGFRPNKGCHTALKAIDSEFQSAKYIIEADIRKCFDNLNHQVIIETIRNQGIKCDKLISLIKQSLEVGYLWKGKLHPNIEAGSPQGSVLSPLLCNIVLHGLDVYMEELKTEHQNGSTRKRSKEYLRAANRAAYMRSKNLHRTNPEEYLGVCKLQRILDSKETSSDYVRTRYVRYADDFIIGIQGPFSLAKQVKERVSQFLNKTLRLELSTEKTTITKWERTPVKFLGCGIMAPQTLRCQKPLEKLKMGSKGRPGVRRKKIRIRFYAPIGSILKRLKTNGIVRAKTTPGKSGIEYRGTFRGNLINLEHPDILKYYNAIIRGIWNYYAFVNNKGALGQIFWVIRESCALTLARKFKLKTQRGAFKKFGKQLTYLAKHAKNEKQKSVSLYKPSLQKERAFFKKELPTDPIDLDNLMNMSWNNKKTRSSIFETCLICGSTPVQMHHLRQIKGMNVKLDFFGKQMAAINRKQVPLCQDHHARLHAGKLTDVERTAFKENGARYKRK
jgi:group II intron reverse transcriptase/maturase